MAGVYGYLEATSDEGRKAARRELLATIDDEIRNTRELLELWKGTTVEVIPLASQGENFALYGENLSSLLERKIALMQSHREDTPAIDPDFMWRTGPECPVSQESYLGY